MATERFKRCFSLARSISIVDGGITKLHSRSLFFIAVIKQEVWGGCYTSHNARTGSLQKPQHILLKPEALNV
jgi:hypothetical protein